MRRVCTLQLQASYTIEAALLMPIFLMALVTGMLLAVDCHEDVSAAAADWSLLEEIRPATRIWQAEMLEYGMEEFFGDTISEKPEK